MALKAQNLDEQPLEVRVVRPAPEDQKRGDEGRQADGERRKDDVKRDGERELQPGEKLRVEIHDKPWESWNFLRKEAFESYVLPPCQIMLKLLFCQSLFLGISRTPVAISTLSSRVLRSFPPHPTRRFNDRRYCIDRS